MLRAAILATATITLAACTTPAKVEEDAPTAERQAAGAAGVAIEKISDAPREGIEDQFLSCVRERENGIRQSQFFLIKDGVVKSYSQMQNYARPMCDAGQAGCALGWQGEEIALYFETESGAVNQMLLDLDTLTMQKRLKSSTSSVEDSTAQCTTGPLPAGVTID